MKKIDPKTFFSQNRWFYRTTFYFVLVVILVALASQTLGLQSGITQILWILLGVMTMFLLSAIKRLLLLLKIDSD